jgi:outer membrane protein TolC
MIPLFGQSRRMAAAERLGAAVAEVELERAQRELAARVEREYIAMWLLDRRRAINADATTLANAMFNVVEEQYAVGRAAHSDMLRIAVEIERLGSERREIDDEHDAARARLNAIIGRDRSVAVTIDDRIDALTPAVLRDADTITRTMLEARVAEHPSLRSMDAMAAMSRAEADAQLAMLDPMLMLRGGRGLGDARGAW